MFLAIINDTYAEVKAELTTQKIEFEIGDYFKRVGQHLLYLKVACALDENWA